MSSNVGQINPSVVQAATTHNYVSSIDLINGLHKPEIDSQLTMRLGDQSLGGFMNTMGLMNPVSNIQYSHYEEEWLHETIKVAGQAAGGAGAAVTHTVPAADTFTTNAPNAPYIDTATEDFILPRRNDLIQYPDGTQALVETVDTVAKTFDAYPIGGGAIPQTTPATEIIIFGNAHEEGSGQPEGRNSRVSLYTNNLMIKKTSHKVTGTEQGQQMWIEVKDKNGKSGWLWYFKAFEDMHTRFQNECEMTMLLAENLTNSTLAALRPTTTISEGLIPFIENYGNNVGYSGVSGFTIGDLDNAVLTLDKERGSKENYIFAGINLSLGMDDTFIDLFQDGAVSYGAFNQNKDLAVNMQFSSFKRGNYVFHKKTFDAFNYKKMLGAAGQKYPEFAMVIPSDKTVEAKTGSKVPSFRMNYLQGKGNGYSRDMEEWLTGGSNGVYNTDVDEINIHYRAHRGLEAFAPNRFLTFFKS